MYTYETARTPDNRPAGLVSKTSTKPTHANNFTSVSSVNTLQRKSNNSTGLPEQIRSRIENLSGFNLSDVKVHYNSTKPAQFHALAYTRGTDIHVASGQERYLSHEAWHVVQQKQGRVYPTGEVNGTNINDNLNLEREADVMAQKILATHPLDCEPLIETNTNMTSSVQFCGRNVLRRQANVADRHAIPAPYTSDDLVVWAKTLMQERIATLFTTQAGLDGHAQQINQEISRLKNFIEGFSCDQDDQNGIEYVQLAMGFLDDIQLTLVKFAAEAAHKRHFAFNIEFYFPFGRELRLSTNDKGSLLVNGKKYGD